MHETHRLITMATVGKASKIMTPYRRSLNRRWFLMRRMKRLIEIFVPSAPMTLAIW